MSLYVDGAGKIVVSGSGAAVTNAGGSGFLPAGHWLAANQSMVNVFPRPSVETIATARQYFAYYDGVTDVPYEIPLAINFGAFPFVITSLSGPTGMTAGLTYLAGSTYMIVSWTPTGSVTNSPVAITVSDQAGATTSFSFNVSTSSSTSKFIFVNADTGNDSTGTGAIGAPYQTLGKIFGTTYAQTINSGAIVYMRGATAKYSLPLFADTSSPVNTFQMATSKKPVAILGYPGETATIDMSNGSSIRFDGDGQDSFFGNFICDSGGASQANYDLFKMVNSDNRITLYKVTWNNVVIGTTGNDNATMVIASDLGGPLHQYITIMDCAENGRPSSTPGNNYCGWSLYSTQYACCFRNTLMPAGSVDACGYLKGGPTDCSMRMNFAYSPNSGGDRVFSVGFQACARIEVEYNTALGFARSEIGDQLVGGDSYANMWWNRNTVIGQLTTHSANSGGPFTYYNNAVQGSAPQVASGTSITASGNITATSGGINSTTGALIGSFAASFGVAGAGIG